MNSKCTIRNSKFAFAACALLFMLTARAEAQRTGKPIVGFFSANSQAAMSVRTGAFRQGLRELGYIEGKNIVVEWRFAEGKVERMGGLAAELLRSKVDVIVTEGTTATRFAKEATSAVPIVMAQDPDPVGTGFVASLARPGGNITGLSNLRPELSGKRLDLLKEIVPRLAGVAVMGTSTTPGTAQSLKETELAAGGLRVQVQYQDILRVEDLEPAFRAATQWRADAFLVLGSPLLLSHRSQVAEFAAKTRLPAIFYTTEFVEDGGLMSYGVAVADLFRRSAYYVDKILKGSKPADLPVEQPTKFELVVNLKTAKQIGLTIPPNVLARADRVIK
jgi:putative tryptophan/tyrosine transport system substrate-binding protein